MKSKLEHLIIALVLTWFAYLAAMTYLMSREEPIVPDPVNIAPHYEIPWTDNEGKG